MLGRHPHATLAAVLHYIGPDSNPASQIRLELIREAML